jgi:hypothetical protein
MCAEAIRQLLGINKRAVAINTVLIANSFIWYMYAFSYLTENIGLLNLDSQFLPIMSIHFATLFLALIIGEFFSHKAKNRLNFLTLWMLTGVFLSLIPAITGITYWGLVLFSIIVGANFGFGISTSLEYFASTTLANNRGKISGTIFLLTGLGAFLLSSIGTNNVLTVSVVLTVWRIIGFLAIKLFKPSAEPTATQPIITYQRLFSNRTFLLYLIPWIIFVFVNSMSFPINESFFASDLVKLSSNIEYVLAGVSAVIFGIFADSKGRKRLAVAGFAMLGLGYAILGLTAPSIYGWWIYTVIDGVTWGILVTLFVFTLWGDVAEGQKSGRIYAIGIMPYLLSSLIRISIGNYFGGYVRDQGIGTIFSFFSFFLFIAVLPLVLAPETLSELTIRNNDLKSYINKAQKEVTKKQKKETKKEEDEGDQKRKESSEEFKKAQELAEKYY